MISIERKKIYFNFIFTIGILLIVFSFVFSKWKENEHHLEKSSKILTEWIQEQNQEVEEIVQDSVLQKVIDSLPLLYAHLDQKVLHEHVGLFILNQEHQTIYWSTNKVSPSNINVNAFGSEQKLVKINNIYHLMKVYPIHEKYSLVSLLTLYQNYPVENRYLQSGFLVESDALQKVKITSREEAVSSQNYPIYSSSQKVLFYIKDNVLAKRAYWWPIVVLEVIGLILIFWVVNRRLRYSLLNQKLYQSILITFIYIAFIEIYINLLHIPTFCAIGNLFQLDSYASPFLADSLGELFFRIHLLHWALRHWVRYVVKQLDHSSPSLSKLFITAHLTLSFYFLVFIIASLHHNSVISFDLNQFDKLNMSSLIGLLVINFAFGLMYIPVNYIQRFRLDQSTILLQIFLHILCVVIGFFFNIFHSLGFVMALVVVYFIYIGFLYWLARKQKLAAKHKFFTSLLLLSSYAFIGAICILYYTQDRKYEMLQYYAVELASERDYAEEFDLSVIIEELKEDNFVKSYFENPYLSSFDINRRVAQRYFNKYQSEYNISVHTFNHEGLQLKGEGTKTFYALNSNKSQRGVQKISPYIYYLSVKPNGEKYMAFIEYYNEETLLGYLIIEFTPKTFVTYSAYPELLKAENDNLSMHQQSDIYYAIYRNRNLMNVSGNYSYPRRYNFPLVMSGKFAIQKDKNYTHVIYCMDEKQVVVTYKRTGLLSSFSYFSYLLIFQMFFFYIMSLMTSYGSLWSTGMKIKKNLKLNTLQKQIQTSMISQVLFSLLLVGSMTLFFFNVQYTHLHNESLKQRGNSVVESLEMMYAENFDVNSGDDLSLILKSKIKQLSEIFAIDMNAYDINGKILYSSQPEIFKNGLQSNLMNPSAYEALKISGYSSFVHDEWIGKLKYLAAYLPINDPNGKLVGYINFPYYGKEKNIKNDISFFLMTLVNIYVLLILGAAMISIWVSKVIVKPLSIITESIKDVELGKKNRHIEWKNKDEIGHLVVEYNRMIDELEDSANLLAKSEREGAWREMAKQVAHEIKNPLTPMKLSIQYLQRAWEDDRDDKEELTTKITSRLIEQIDTLANIATAFSNFAKMPVGNPQNENVVNVLHSVVDIFSTDEYLELNTFIPDREIYAFIDKDQMVRVFTNLIKNAIQAIPEGQKGRLDIGIEETETHCNIIVKDNGIGIPPERALDIFEPNFTTKSSGTGLGLAMSKSIIESAGGKIWFESNQDQSGSTFYVQLVKVKM